MYASARILGQDYGLTAQEMNKVLVKEGFLEGKPGDYSPTEKVLKYLKETDYHRGCGGYDRYNRYWTERSYDISIKDELNITDELKKLVREEVSAERIAKKLEREAASQRYYDNLKLNNEITNKITEEIIQPSKGIDSKYIVIGGIIALVVGGGVTAFFVIRHYRKKKMTESLSGNA